MHPSSVPDGISHMVGALSHRGPDESRIWCHPAERVVLGHTRLQILDVLGSTQPMANEDGNVVVTYNGEIYNFAELRQLLIARGHTFRSKGDTEVLVHLYEEYGPAMVERLDGMFAFGLYDARRHSMLLARDRIGIKPLYYWHAPQTGELLFASDMSGLLANPALPRQLNPRALGQFFHFGYVVHPQSWLVDVYQVEPGETVVWSDGALTRSKYYSWQYAPRDELRDSDVAARELEQCLSESVNSHLISDVPLGSFLSGGLDSSAVTGFAQRQRARSGDVLRSFTVRMDDPSLDESARARNIAKGIATHHTQIDAETLSFERTFMENLVDRLGEPFADTSMLPVNMLCQQVRPFVKVALSGDGGDEIFLGYSGLAKQRLARRFRVLPRWLRRAALRSSNGHAGTLGRRVNRYMQLSLLDDPSLVVEWARRFQLAELRTLLEGDVFGNLFPSPAEPFPEIQRLIGHGDSGGFLEQQIRFHMLVDLPCDCLFKVDRMAMAHGLEVRVPMLSNRMLDYASTLPLRSRARGSRNKEPLRTVAERVVPMLTEPFPKHGFNFPLHPWMAGRAAGLWGDWELTSTLREVGFNPAAVDRLVASYERSGAAQQSYEVNSLATRVFQLTLVGLWAEKNRVRLT